MTSQEFFQGHHALLLNSGIVGSVSGLVSPWSRMAGLNTSDDAVQTAAADEPAKLLPITPFEPSRHRAGGYAMWDFILANGTSELRTNPGNTKLSSGTLKPVYPEIANPVVQELLSARSSRIPHPYECNFTQLQERRRHLMMLHALAHDANSNVAAPSALHRQYTMFAEDMLQATADAAVARAFKLPLRQDSSVTRLPYGIVACYTARYNYGNRQPVIWFPHDLGKRQLLDSVFAVVAVAIDIGPPPIEFVIPGHEPDPLNAWWSFQPMRTTILGWETVDWMAGQEITALPRYNVQDRTRTGFSALIRDTMPPATFKYYLHEARQHFTTLYDDFTPIDDYQFLETWGLLAMDRPVPPLPCPLCAIFPTAAESTLVQPKGVPSSNPDKSKEWTEYFKELRKVFKSIARAKNRYEGRKYRTAMQIMRKQWNRHCRILRKKHRMTNKW